MRSLNSLMIQGDAKHWEPEELFMAGGTARFLGDSTFTLAWQLALGWARIDWSRSMQYLGGRKGPIQRSRHAALRLRRGS